MFQFFRGSVLDVYRLLSPITLVYQILELRDANDQKKAAFASQAAAESVMRRLQAALKENPEPEYEAMVAALEAELKIAVNEVNSTFKVVILLLLFWILIHFSLELQISKLSEDNKAQERNLRAKEVALLKAEEDVQSANEKAAQVDILQNLNTKLEKQLGLCEVKRNAESQICSHQNSLHLLKKLCF